MSRQTFDLMRQDASEVASRLCVKAHICLVKNGVTIIFSYEAIIKGWQPELDFENRTGSAFRELHWLSKKGDFDWIRVMIIIVLYVRSLWPKETPVSAHLWHCDKKVKLILSAFFLQFFVEILKLFLCGKM